MATTLLKEDKRPFQDYHLIQKDHLLLRHLLNLLMLHNLLFHHLLLPHRGWRPAHLRPSPPGSA